MWFSLITFFIALVGLMVLLGYQLRNIRTKRVLIKEDSSGIERPFLYLNHEDLEARVGSFMRHMLRVFMLWILRISIKASFFARRKIDAIVHKAKKLAERHQKEIKEKEESAGGRFLKAIGEYKTKIEKLRKKDKTFDDM